MLLAAVVFVAMAACVDFPTEFTGCLKVTQPDGSTTCVDTIYVVVETPP
jgi:hypothetical protein